MPFTCAIEGPVLHVCWYGAITHQDLDAFGAEMPRIGRSLGMAPDVLHTFVAITGLGLEPIEAFTYSLRHNQEPIPSPIRSAIVTDSGEGEALATVFKELNRTPNLEMKVFRTEAEARRWLARA
jgi:hypothetical protein